MFTICIPTFKRPEHLKRLLYFYEKCNKDFKIFIGDSNTLDDFNKNKEFIKTLKNFHNIKIFHNPRKDYMNVMETHKILLANIKTKYMVFCPDDDVQIPSSIYKMCKVLELNSDLIGVNGIALHYDPFNNYYAKYPLRGLEQNTSLERLVSLFENYFGILFSVFKTDKIKFIFNNLYEKNETLKAEFHPSCYVAILGKIINLKEIQLIRPAENQNKYKLKELKVNEYHMKEFLDILSLAVSKKDKTNLYNTKNILKNSINKLITKKKENLILTRVKNYLFNKKIRKIIDNNSIQEITDLKFLINEKSINNK